MIANENKKIDISIVDEISYEFLNEQEVNVIWYTWDVMEPFISRDEEYLFFNDNGWENDKDLFYAEKIDNLNFKYIWGLKWANTKSVDGNPSMDSDNNFYFISTRDLASWDLSTIYKGIFKDWELKDIERIKSNINTWKPFWVNMWVEISADWEYMYSSNAKFFLGATIPSKWNLKYAVNNWGRFVVAKDEKEIFKNLNNDHSIQYAGETSEDQLEIFYSQVTLWKKPIFKLYYSKRESVSEAFWKPKLIKEAFWWDEYAFVEAPCLSSDKERLYYHKLKDWRFRLFLLTRK